MKKKNKEKKYKKPNCVLAHKRKMKHRRKNHK